MQVDAYPHEGITELFKALSDPTRLRILALLLLHTGELCGCEVESTLGITQTRASRALTTLRRAGLVAARRDGAWVHHAVTPQPQGLVKAVLAGLRQSLADDPVVQADVANLKRMCCE
ncbi:MAG: metalloregulator ArsR/SmtB family transcription factor [Planctomycetes bacterium]|nr:metalloregulator ArsR/SmtB family transcription factor [Planctomycetota bacterium]